MSKSVAAPAPGKGPRRFVAYYIHYRTKKKMVAAEYGYKGWPFLGGGPKKAS